MSPFLNGVTVCGVHSACHEEVGQGEPRPHFLMVSPSVEFIVHVMKKWAKENRVPIS